jgi:ribosome biogenesis GTPase
MPQARSPESGAHPGLIPGLIVRTQSGFFTVETGEGQLVSELRGRLKRGAREGDLAAIGDQVMVRKIEGDRGLIEQILPRDRTLSRMAPLPHGEYHQIIIANPDQAVFVFACADPTPRLRMLDRFLVIAEKQQIPCVIVANKVDLVGKRLAMDLFDRYEPLGYPVLYTSARTRLGIPSFRRILKEKISVLTGPSGVGKSSLMNAVQPGLGLAVNQVSEGTGRGKHTTVASQLFPLEGGGYVADTPGLKALALWDVEPEELDGYFPEIRELVANCQFNNCSHIHEPGCAVQAAVQTGWIHPERFESYVRIRLGQED